MADNEAEVYENDRPRGRGLKSVFTDMLPLEQRQLLGTLVFFAIILIAGWVGVNEPERMQTFTAQYEGRSIERGAAIFNQNCSSCHGVDGRGLEGVAPALNTPEMFDGTRLAEIGWSGTLHDYVELTVSAGRPAKSGDWPQPMPTWSQEYGGPMRPDQVRDVVNYVINYGKFYEAGYEGEIPEVTLPTAVAPSYEPVGDDVSVELPVGNPERGQTLFTGEELAPDGTNLACSSCHSLDGSVIVGPSLQGIASEELPAGYDSLDTFLHESIVQPGAYKVPGFENVNMPDTFGERLDAQSLADLIAFLKTQ